MPSFISQAVEKLIAENADFRKVAVVMPSRRALVFLQRELSNQLKKPAFSPSFFTIEDLITKATKLELEEPLGLLFKAYEAYSSVAEKPEGFSDFSKWAHLLLADFNEVDRYLIDAPKLFSYLADIKRIENWNLEPKPTELIENYLELWRLLPKVYEELSAKLLKEGKAYQGLAYRQFAENIIEILPSLFKDYHSYYFFGFSALNKAEEEIFLHFYESGKASFLWDVDEYYFKDDRHEAGKFMRESRLIKRLRERQEFYGLHSELCSKAKSIESISVSGNHLQGVIANQILNNYEKQNWEQTALVLADEALLPAVLNNLNSKIPSLNITMGLPLQNSPLAGFFYQLLSFRTAFERKPKKDKNGEAQFFHQLWDDLLSNLVSKRLLANSAINTEHLRDVIRKRNLVYSSYAQLRALGLQAVFPNELFASELELPEYFEALAQFCEKSKTSISKDQTEILFGFFKLFNQLSASFSKYPYVSDFESARYLFRDLVKQLNQDILGEPLSGLQLMGMLETRTLDFNNLIILSLNEDILPKGRSDNSLIPFDVKREYGLPTFLDKDAVYAYHFYRLLQRANRVHMIYNTASIGLGVGEASRFVKQVEMELKEAHDKKLLKSSFTQKSFTGKLQAASLEGVEIKKTDATMQRLHEMAEKGFSPTALREYLKSPLEFYYKRVLKIDEAEELEEEIDFRLQGLVIHELLERFYGEKNEGEKTKAYNTNANSAIFKLKASDLRALIETELSAQIKVEDFSGGKNMLIMEVLNNMLVNFLRFDQKRFQNDTDLEVLSLEESLEYRLKVNEKLSVKIHGMADRIDQTANGIRIIDYKTGADNEQDFTLSSLEQLSQKPKAIQLFIYAYLYMKNHTEHNFVKPSIISLRKVNNGFINLKLRGKQGVTEDLIDDFEVYLKLLFQEIFNPEVPFTENRNPVHENG